MNTKNWMSLTAAAVLTLTGFSCNDDWGQVDPPAGNQVYPTLQNVSSITFDGEEGAALPSGMVLDGAVSPSLVYDDSIASNALSLNGGVASMPNPLNTVKLQKAAGITMWVCQPVAEGAQRDLSAPLITFDNSLQPVAPEPVEPQAHNNQAAPNSISISVNGDITVDGNVVASGVNLTDSLTANKWHFVGLDIHDKGFNYYVDGSLVASQTVDNFGALVAAVNSASTVKFGGTDGEEMMYDDVIFFRNQMTVKEIARPKKGNTGGGVKLSPLPDPIYFNNFEYGLNGATIQGKGQIEHFDNVFGNVFQNVGGEHRSNFLVLPEDAMLRSGETQEITITMWVNATNAGPSNSYMWSPIFGAYSDAKSGDNTNHAPIFTLQYRGLVANNMNGADNAGDNWCDYTDDQHDNGKCEVRHDATDWLADHKWHMYTAVFTKTTAAVYFDDELINSWTIDGVSKGARCEIFGSPDLKYICVGGNQSWWNDPDLGAAFDNVAIYNKALDKDQIATLYSLQAMPQPIYTLDFEHGLETATVQGKGTIDNFDAAFGNVFQNVGSEHRSNFLVLPEDAMIRSGETQELTINMWVNATNAGPSNSYMWSPIFGAYSDAKSGDNTNHAPIFTLQYRGLVANNMNGADNAGDNWCDYTDDQHDNGKCEVRHDATDWLADHKWHMYTAVFTKTTAAVYFDDELINSWTIDGVSKGARCEIFGSPELRYICVGGNQSWWNDPDLGAAFDNVRIYNKALTDTEIGTLFQLKKH